MTDVNGRGRRRNHSRSARPKPPRNRLVQAESGSVYELEALLRDGHHAAVWKASLLDRDLAVALKLFTRHDAVHNVDWNAHEFAILTRLPEEHIAKPIEHGRLVGGRDSFIATEYLAGGTLKDRLKQRRPADPIHSAIACGQAVALALKQTHEVRVLHLDVKPSNIGFSKDGRIKLIDFGSSPGASDPRIRRVSGTPMYCSPEQAAGFQARPASDIYSLGCVLYEILEGHPPFVRDSVVDYLQAHRNEVPPPLSSMYVGAPSRAQAMASLVGRMLVKNPHARISLDNVLIALRATQGLTRPKHARQNNFIQPEVRKWAPTVWAERYSTGSKESSPTDQLRVEI